METQSREVVVEIERRKLQAAFIKTNLQDSTNRSFKVIDDEKGEPRMTPRIL